MKIAPIINAIKVFQKQGADIKFMLIHTGQHYDKNLNEVFFTELGIPHPDINLGVGSGSHGQQTARIMERFEEVLPSLNPDLVIVVGDVNSTMACSIVAKKMGVKVAHVEAGIRSFDQTMPEEINRMVTDSICDYFFTTTEIANRNLINAGIKTGRIFLVGNTMVDTLMTNITKVKKPEIWDKEALQEKKYLVLTLHRPKNVDNGQNLETLIKEIAENAGEGKIVFPMHPRTAKNLRNLNYPNLICVNPMSYLNFIFLIKNALAVITDSGGIQEETTMLGVPCLTLRDNTERPETVDIGTNELLGTKYDNLGYYLSKIYEGKWKKGQTPAYWDGKTATRIVSKIMELDL